MHFLTQASENVGEKAGGKRGGQRVPLLRLNRLRLGHLASSSGGNVELEFLDSIDQHIQQRGISKLAERYRDGPIGERPEERAFAGYNIVVWRKELECLEQDVVLSGGEE